MKRKNYNSNKATIRLTPEQEQQVNELMTATKLTKTQIIRYLIDSALKNK